MGLGAGNKCLSASTFTVPLAICDALHLSVWCKCYIKVFHIKDIYKIAKVVLQPANPFYSYFESIFF